MVGDGTTDMEASPEVDLFVGFGGNQVLFIRIFTVSDVKDRLRSRFGLARRNIINFLKIETGCIWLTCETHFLPIVHAVKITEKCSQTIHKPVMQYVILPCSKKKKKRI